MRAQLRKSGLNIVIILSIIAIAFFPKQVSQWVVLGVVSVWALIHIAFFCIKHKTFFESKKLQFKSAENNKKEEPDNLIAESFYSALLQLSHRITDKLHSAYPEATWNWKDKPNSAFFMNGGRLRIATMNTDSFNEADVIIDKLGRIDIRMLQSSGISDVMKSVTDKAETDFTVDVEVWYEQRGKQVLVDVITDLNSRGTKTLTISEDGSITTEDDIEVGNLAAFPAKNLWEKLIDILVKDNLNAEEKNGKLQLNW